MTAPKEARVPHVPAPSSVSVQPQAPAKSRDPARPQGSREDETRPGERKLAKDRSASGAEIQEAPKTPAARPSGLSHKVVVLTKEQEQEIVKRFQKYVDGLERPPKGRRRTIAVEMGLPYRVIASTIGKWKQQLYQGKDLSREERFLVERSYFKFLEQENTFSQVKEQIAGETGVCQCQVARWLDLLHDGEKKLRNVPDVSPEEKQAIVSEYRSYLSAAAPPDPPLHALIAEKTGVTPKQVYKVLLAYRLNLFRDRLGQAALT